MNQRIKIGLAAVAILAVLSAAGAAVSNPEGGFLENVNQTNVSRDVAQANRAGARMELVSSDHLTPEASNGHGATSYVGYLPPIETITARLATDHWQAYE